MRTTITLDDDLAARLASEARRLGLPFKSVVNDAIRRGLLREAEAHEEPFVVDPRPLGLRPGLSYDDIETLLDLVEGPARR